MSPHLEALGELALGEAGVILRQLADHALGGRRRERVAEPAEEVRRRDQHEATARGGGASLDDVAAKPTHIAAPVGPSHVTVTPIVVPARVAVPAKPATITVHIESLPGGAIATLLDNGKPTQLGMTPLDAELDPAKAYDVVVSLDGRTPRVQHLVPAQQQDLVFAFDADVAPPAKTVAPVAHVEPKHADKPAVEAAIGTLKIASKPPCAIAIDGRATGKMTLHQMRSSLAPSMRAASSRSSGTVLKACRSRKMLNTVARLGKIRANSES